MLQAELARERDQLLVNAADAKKVQARTAEALSSVQAELAREHQLVLEMEAAGKQGQARAAEALQDVQVCTSLLVSACSRVAASFFVWPDHSLSCPLSISLSCSLALPLFGSVPPSLSGVPSGAAGQGANLGAGV